jgi:hypothetical protein
MIIWVSSLFIFCTFCGLDSTPLHATVDFRTFHYLVWLILLFCKTKRLSSYFISCDKNDTPNHISLECNWFFFFSLPWGIFFRFPPNSLFFFFSLCLLQQGHTIKKKSSHWHLIFWLASLFCANNHRLSPNNCLLECIVSRNYFHIFISGGQKTQKIIVSTDCYVIVQLI